jgi:phosphoribosyl 1,2-cyclic phosphodiesterase
MLRIGQRRLDAILLTHEHTDHIFGLDDIRKNGCKRFCVVCLIMCSKK